MEAEVARAKASLRGAMRERRRSLPQSARAQASLRAAELALSLPELQRAGRIALYGALPEELDPEPLARALLARGRSLCYPKVMPEKKLAFFPSTPEGLGLSPKKIPEPFTAAPAVPIDSIDVFLLPGLAFDQEGGRLGFGGGYYDRALEEARTDALRLGFGFDFQVVERVPKTPRDAPIDAIATEQRLLRAPRRPF